MSSHPKCAICGRFIKLSELDRKDVYDHSGLSDTIFYHKSCINPPPMTKELEAEISQKASEYATGNEYARIDYINGAWEYAFLYLESERRLKIATDALERIRDTRSIIGNPLEIRRIIEEALALFPVDKKNSQENK